MPHEKCLTAASPILDLPWVDEALLSLLVSFCPRGTSIIFQLTAPFIFCTVRPLMHFFANDSDLVPQQQHLSDLSLLIPDLNFSLSLLQSRLLNEDPDSEVSVFRRCRQTARSLFPRSWPVPLFDFATELLTLVASRNDVVTAARLSLDACARDDTQPSSKRTARFNVVVLASRPVWENAEALARVFDDVCAFSDGAHFPRQDGLALSITMVPGSGADGAQFDRLRDRLAIRLAILSTADLGWRERTIVRKTHSL